MIKKDNKRIMITLQKETLEKCESWLWMKSSWSYWVNESLKLMIEIMNRNNPIADIMKTRKIKKIKTIIILDDGTEIEP